jgi:chaperone modulatory protein CbpM
MEQQEYIPLDVFCRHHHIETSFIHSLQEFGLIEIAEVEQRRYLPLSQLTEAEKLVRLHNELEINTAGIDVVTHLLQRIQNMQEKIRLLKNRLRLYEDDFL